jgi:hypothetical protein
MPLDKSVRFELPNGSFLPGGSRLSIGTIGSRASSLYERTTFNAGVVAVAVSTAGRAGFRRPSHQILIRFVTGAVMNRA